MALAKTQYAHFGDVDISDVPRTPRRGVEVRCRPHAREVIKRPVASLS